MTGGRESPSTFLGRVPVCVDSDTGPLPPVFSPPDCLGFRLTSRSTDLPSKERTSPFSSSRWSLWRVQLPPQMAQISRWALQEAYLQVQFHQLVFLHEVVESPSPKPGLSSLVFLPQVDEDTQALLDAAKGPPEGPEGQRRHRLIRREGSKGPLSP